MSSPTILFGFIDAFVDGVDLAAAGFKRVTPQVTGRAQW
jgi:hypothetical protein